MAAEINTSRDPKIFYESTPDGDIRTIVKEDPNGKNGDNIDGSGSDLFQRHLRKSWDEEYEGLAIVDGAGKTVPSQKQKRHNRHKHNLSVQFFDISISGDTAVNKGKNNNEAEQPSTTTPMNVTIPPPPINTANSAPASPGHTRTKSALEVEAAAAYYFEDDEADNDPSPNTKDRAKNDDIANFQKNVHSSWESGDEEDEEDEDNETQRQPHQSTNTYSKPNKPQHRRHRNNLSVQFTDDTFFAKDDGKEETVPSGNGATATTTAQEFQRPPLPAAGPAGASNREARTSQFSYDQTQQQQQNRPPAPPAGIVVPVPIVVRPSISRKHHRVYSGRSNPAVAHRRVNTRGDSAPTKEEAWAPAAIPHPHPNSLPPPPSPHHPAHPPHPASGGHPYPPPYYHQGTPPLQPYGSAPTPPPQPYGSAPTPPPYDPYYAASQPVDPRYYAAPSPHHYISSPVSDAGVNYDARATSPMVYPSPSGGGGQYPQSAHSSPGGYYADQMPPPPAASPYGRPPNYLAQPSLDREQHQQLGEKSVSDRSKENNNEGGNGAAHHRKQSSLGSFLANSGFEDLFDDRGYDSAPEEQQSKRHNKNLSSASFLRSLSSDNFLKDHLEAVEEERHSGGNSPYASPHPNSTPTSPGGAYQPYPGYYSYGPPQPTSQWQQPKTYLQHSPIQPLPSTHQRHLFGGEAIQTQFPPPSPPHQCLEVSASNSDDLGDSNQKRQRRKCSMPDCPNRVVQGGLCIGHGAKRKTCAHPGCSKNVKAKGLCSTHGPARKRCNAEGCAKVAVQGGRCIAHGAKKKVCSYGDCTKQAIMGGMCKKHHDETNGVVKVRGQRKSKDGSPTISSTKGHPGHERGLSLFTDSAIVDTIISNSSVDEQENDGAL